MSKVKSSRFALMRLIGSGDFDEADKELIKAFAPSIYGKNNDKINLMIKALTKYLGIDEKWLDANTNIFGQELKNKEILKAYLAHAINETKELGFSSRRLVKVAEFTLSFVEATLKSAVEFVNIISGRKLKAAYNKVADFSDKVVSWLKKEKYQAKSRDRKFIDDREFHELRERFHNIFDTERLLVESIIEQTLGNLKGGKRPQKSSDEVIITVNMEEGQKTSLKKDLRKLIGHLHSEDQERLGAVDHFITRLATHLGVNSAIDKRTELLPGLDLSNREVMKIFVDKALLQAKQEGLTISRIRSGFRFLRDGIRIFMHGFGDVLNSGAHKLVRREFKDTDHLIKDADYKKAKKHYKEFSHGERLQAKKAIAILGETFKKSVTPSRDTSSVILRGRH